MSIEQWQDHFRAEAKRILKQFERSDPIIEPETVEAIEELYAGMPDQLREIVDDRYADEERHPGKLLIEMMQVELATETVLARKAMQ